jgi:ABC-2 type transport system permease protein
VNTNTKYIGFKTLVSKEVRRWMRIWVQTLIPPVITVLLYFLIFGGLIGSRIGQMGGFDYMQYVVPGLVMMSVITNSFSNTVSSFFGAKFQSHIEELLISPMPNYLIIWGFVIGGVLRGLAVGSIVMLLAFSVTNLRIDNVFCTLLIVFLTSLFFSLAGLINAIFATSFDDISIIPTFVLTPLIYLGGVFYSIDLLPEFWRDVSMLNPVLYMVNAFRYGILGVSDVSIAFSFVMIIFFIVVAYLYVLYLFKTGKRLRS